MHRTLLLLICVLPGPLACAQPLSVPQGQDGQLEAATWNLEWFGSTEFGPDDEVRQLQNVARVIAGAQFDLWALQEIDDDHAFEVLLAELGPDYGGLVGTSSTNFLLGFIYRREAMRPLRASDAWMYAHRSVFAGRPPLLAEFEVTLPDTTFILAVVTLHMKCCADGREMRRDASELLKGRLDQALANRPVLVLGDFNDELGGDSPYQNFLADTGGYRVATTTIDARDEPTWCANAACTSGSTLDHIVVTDELFDAQGEEFTGSAERLDALLADIPHYLATTSDHLPVAVRLWFGAQGLTAGPIANPAPGISLFPTPISTVATLEYALPRPGHVTIELLDPLGRLVRFIEDRYHPPGKYRTQIDATGLPGGMYLLVLRDDDRVRVRRFAVVH